MELLADYALRLEPVDSLTERNLRELTAVRRPNMRQVQSDHSRRAARPSGIPKKYLLKSYPSPEPDLPPAQQRRQCESAKAAVITSLMMTRLADSNPTAPGSFGPDSGATVKPLSRSNTTAIIFVASPPTPPKAGSSLSQDSRMRQRAAVAKAAPRGFARDLVRRLVVYSTYWYLLICLLPLRL